MRIVGIIVPLVLVACSPSRVTERTVTVEFVLAETEPGEGLLAYEDHDGDRFYLHSSPVMSTGDIESASRSDRDGLPGIEIEFTDEGRAKFARVTRENTGKRLAILLDGRVVTAPHIMEPIEGGEARITGLTEDEAERLVRDFNR